MTVFSFHDDVLADIETELEQLVVDERLPGLSVGLVLDQELAWFKGFGTRDLATGEPADQHTLHRVASITKTLTTAAVLQLRDRGLLALDDQLERHLPEFAGVREVAGRRDQVTLLRLLTHRAGLVTETPLPTWSTDEFPSREEILAALPQTEIVLPADHAFKYSNLAFGLLGEVVARVAGQDYFEYVTEHLLVPLGMTGSVYWLPEDERHRMAVGYSPDLFRDGLKPAPYVSLGGVAACGQLHSSVATAPVGSRCSSERANTQCPTTSCPRTRWMTSTSRGTPNQTGQRRSAWAGGHSVWARTSTTVTVAEFSDSPPRSCSHASTGSVPSSWPTSGPTR